MATFYEKPLRAELDLSEGEEALIAASETGNTSQINKTRIFSQILTMKKIEASVEKMVASNERLSNSNDRYAKAMNYLTLGLLVVAILQVVVGLLR